MLVLTFSSMSRREEAVTDTDRELVARVIAGERAAADEFVDRFAQFVWHVLREDCDLVGADAEDAFQDVFVRLFDDGCRRLDLWRGDGPFAPYLSPIVRHAGIDLRRRRGLPPVAGPGEDGRSGPAAGDPTPEELAEIAEQRESLGLAVTRLSADDRALYELRYVENLSSGEIAKRMGIQVNAVYQRVHRLEQRLKRLLT